MDLFKYVKPNYYPIRTKLGYGCLNTSRKPYEKAKRRKVLRFLRKYKFDISETWSLDCTIMYWLSDNVGGFFRECGNQWDWGETDLEGNRWNEGVATENFIKAEKLRQDEYLKRLKEYLINTNDGEYSRFIAFVIPRILHLSEHTNGYPTMYKNFEEWQKTMKEMVDELEKHNVDKFIENFFSLWD
jgi:hypothetical protein